MLLHPSEDGIILDEVLYFEVGETVVKEAELFYLSFSFSGSVT